MDALPLIRANTDSRLDFNGEVAMSLPNPNTRGEVYLDDFEGAASTDLVTLGRLGWYQASRPVTTDDERTFDYEDRVDDPVQAVRSYQAVIELDDAHL